MHSLDHMPQQEQSLLPRKQVAVGEEVGKTGVG